VLVLVALTLLSIVGYAFAYTYLLNKTGSVLLCILLHAGIDTAMSSAGLRTEAALQRWVPLPDLLPRGRKVGDLLEILRADGSRPPATGNP
jgi:hypothetical protein